MIELGQSKNLIAWPCEYCNYVVHSLHHYHIVIKLKPIMAYHTLLQVIRFYCRLYLTMSNVSSISQVPSYNNLKMCTFNYGIIILSMHVISSYLAMSSQCFHFSFNTAWTFEVISYFIGRTFTLGSFKIHGLFSIICTSQPTIIPFLWTSVHYLFTKNKRS